MIFNFGALQEQDTSEKEWHNYLAQASSRRRRFKRNAPWLAKDRNHPALPTARFQADFQSSLEPRLNLRKTVHSINRRSTGPNNCDAVGV